MRVACDGAGQSLGCGGSSAKAQRWSAGNQTAQVHNSGQTLHLITYLVPASFSLRAQLQASLVPRLRFPVSAICSEISRADAGSNATVICGRQVCLPGHCMMQEGRGWPLGA